MNNFYRLLLCLLSVTLIAQASNAQQLYVVSQTTDDGTGQPNTLSAAIALANAYNGSESSIEIRFDIDSVALTGTALARLNNLASVKKPIALKGLSTKTVVQRVSASLFRVFEVDTNNVVSFENLIIRGGDLTTQTGSFARSGAGVRVDSGATATFERCIIEQNTTTGFGVAAGISAFRSRFTLKNCVVRANSNSSITAVAIGSNVGAEVNLVNSFVVENLCSGIRVNGGNLSISHSIVARNAGIGVDGNSPDGIAAVSFCNSIFAENQDFDLAGSFNWLPFQPRPTFVRYSLIQNPDPFLIDPLVIFDGANGQIVGKSPSFVNSLAGDYRLNLNSPALERGVNDTTGLNFFVPIELPSVDFEGKTLRGDFRELGAFEMGGNVVLVTTPFNSGAGSLRQAIQDAFPGDTIRIASLIDTIRVGGLPTLAIRKSLTIEHSTPQRVVITDTAATRRLILNVAIGDTTTLNGQPFYRYGTLSLSGFHLFRGGGALNQAIRSEANLNLKNCLITEHLNSGDVVEIIGGNLTMQNVQILNNGAASDNLILSVRFLNDKFPVVKMTNCAIGGNNGISAIFNGCASAELINCSIANNAGEGLVSFNATVPDLKNTIVAYNGVNLLAANGFTETNSITTNPSAYPFHSPRNLRLLPTATTLIGQGTSIGAPPFDLDGNPRPLNPSIGAFEGIALSPTAQATLSNISSTITFPGTFITLSPSSPVVGDITVLFFDNGRAGDIPTLNASPYYWTISSTSSVLPNITMTIDWNSVPNNFVGNPNTLDVIKRDGFGQPWTLLSGLTRNPTNISFVVNSFSDFALAGDGDNPLPVELSEFRGANGARGIALSWITSSEVENMGFEIRRRLQGEMDWLTIASYQNTPSLRGRGTTSEQTNYAFEDETVERGRTYQYRLRSYDFNGAMHDYPNTVTVEARNDASVARRYALMQNYPNPFNPTTLIRYELATRGEVKLELFDMLGRKVATLVNATQEAGAHSYSLDASKFSLSSGVYFYRLESGRFSRTMKLMLVK